jgi:hypothetical protein
MAQGSVGLTRREMERELKWILRSPPDDPKKLGKLLAEAMVSLIEKNNAKIAEDLARETSPDLEEDY